MRETGERSMRYFLAPIIRSPIIRSPIIRSITFAFVIFGSAFLGVVGVSDRGLALNGYVDDVQEVMRQNRPVVSGFFLNSDLFETKNFKKFYAKSMGTGASVPGLFLSKSLNLLRRGLATPEEAVVARLYDGAVDPRIQIKLTSDRKRLSGDRTTQEFAMFFAGIRLCEFHIKAHTFRSKDQMISGYLPVGRGWNLNDGQISFPDPREVENRLAEAITSDGTNLRFGKFEKCLISRHGDVLPVFKVPISANGLPYVGIADGERVYDLQKNYFAVSGVVSAYETNPLDQTIHDYPVDFSGDERMTTAEFSTDLGPDRDRASESDHRFRYLPAQEEFHEANAFLHVLRMYDWFKTLGYKWTTDPLTIRTSPSIPFPDGSTSPNNALYLPNGFTGRDSPIIAIAYGDGLVHRNLTLDFDVAAHEFVHHIVRDSLRSTTQSESENGDPEEANHSGALHEGLADFFAFEMTNDACLGESICPPGTDACYVMTASKQCLRSGTTRLKYGTREYWDIDERAFHLRGQVVSGMMWDIRSLPNVDVNEFTKLAYGAIDYLLPISSYSDWLVALMTADRELFDGKYGCDIAEAAKARGFAAQADEHIKSCKRFNAPTPSGDDPVDPTEKEPKNSSGVVGSSEDGTAKGGGASKPNTRSTSSGTCGTLAATQYSSESALAMIWLVLMAVPLALGLRSR